MIPLIIEVFLPIMKLYRIQLVTDPSNAPEGIKLGGRAKQLYPDRTVRRYSMAQQRAEPYDQFPLQGHRCASEVMGVSYDIMYWYLCNTMSPLHAILIFLSKTR